MAQTFQQEPVARLKELEGPALLDQIVDGLKTDERKHAETLIKNIVEQIIDPSFVVEKGVTETINARISAIDRTLSRQLDAVLHHADFQKLESSWRGLHKLVHGTETGEFLKLRVLNVGKKELLRDFQSASEFTESALWKAVYEYEFGLFGGDPFGALVGDYEFGKGPMEVELLTHMSQVAAAAHAPFITAAGAQMFGMQSLTEMPNPRDVAKIFDKNNPENTKWLSFRDSEDSRFVTMVLPHVLRRLPYGK